MKAHIWSALVVSLVVGSPAAAHGQVAALPLPAGAAMILNTGDSATTGYRIVVLPSGVTTSVDATGVAHGQLPQALADRFFRDLSAAMPLSQLPSSSCANAAAMTLPTFLTVSGQRSSNIDCGSDPKTSALSWDAQAIARALYVSNYRVMPGRIYFQSNGGGLPAPAPVQQPPSMPTYPSGYGTMGY